MKGSVRRRATLMSVQEERKEKKKTLVSDAARSSERETPRCLSLFVEVMSRVSKISNPSLCLGKEKKILN